MDLNKNGKLLLELRKVKGMTQKQVAEKIGVCAKTVSKWETGHGFPDVAILPALAEILGVNTDTILSGKLTQNEEETGNMKKIKFYVCSKCSNILFQSGNGELCCCGKKLNPLVSKAVDENHKPSIEPVEDDLFLSFNHEMTKSSYISFVAGIKDDSVLLVRLYPEQNAQVRLPRQYGRKICFYCNNHGLFEIK